MCALVANSLMLWAKASAIDALERRRFGLRFLMGRESESIGSTVARWLQLFIHLSGCQITVFTNIITYMMFANIVQVMILIFVDDVTWAHSLPRENAAWVDSQRVSGCRGFCGRVWPRS